MLIKVMNFPSKFEKKEFLTWYDEVFRETHKNVEPTTDIMIAIDTVRQLGYNVQWNDDMYCEQDIPFTREQLIFVIEASMAGAFDKVQGALPQNKSELIFFQDIGNEVELANFRSGAVASVGIFVPILWAQTEGKRVGDGMGTCDFPYWKEFVERCEGFANKRIAGDFSEDWVNFRDLAENIVDECWSEYLSQKSGDPE